MTSGDCVLCDSAGENVLWRADQCRVIRVDDPHYPGFCRVIWHQHVREMTDLSPDDRAFLMRIVFAVESAVRQCCSPDKVNLASFGNMVPHVHWHIIPRWVDDRHFPEPIWGTVRQIAPTARAPIADEVLAAAIAQQIGQPSR